MAQAKSQGASAPLTSSASVEICRDLFGEHPEDVIAPIHCTADALMWLETIFQAIARDALKKGPGYRIKYLAEAGAYIANDMGNYAEHFHETVIQRLRDAGVAQTSAEESCHE